MVGKDAIISEYCPPYAYKLISGNIGVNDTKITLPLYMTMFFPAGGEGVGAFLQDLPDGD